MDKRTKVIGFPVDSFEKSYLDSLNSSYLFELGCETEESIIYDSVDEFLSELNDDLVDTENNFWYYV